MVDKLKKISIIVPVYNVEPYIDQCLESICKQTFTNLEIIVVYDTSTDGTLAKCQKWDEEDERIVLIINHNRNGLGAARNTGFHAATGEYIVYVDSDDWIDSNYIEILYNAIEQTHANYVSSVGFFKVRADGKVSKSTYLPAGLYSGDIAKSLVLLKEAPAVWKKIYNRKWLIDQSLLQPELFHYEDWGYDMALVLLAEKIVLIKDIGVFYRVEREGRLTNDSMESLYSDFRKSIEFGLDKAEQAKVLDKYRIVILKYLLQDYYFRERMAFAANNEKALQILGRIKSDILIKRLDCQNTEMYRRHICFGSFSLRRIVQRTTVFAKNLEYYGFSSIISAFSQGQSVEVKNQNEFRIEQVSKDVTGAFEKVISSVKEKTLLFLDFLEERNPVFELEDGRFITGSEAYRDSFVEGGSAKNIFQSGMDEFMSLWKEKCSALVENLSNKKNIMDVILIKNRMALRYGDFNGTKEFPEVQKLAQLNMMLAELEEIFLEECQIKNISVKVLDMPDEYCFTDEQFMYGCEPQYMNEALYTYLGFEIFKGYIGNMVDK